MPGPFTPTHLVDQLTYGIEIECFVPVSAATEHNVRPDNRSVPAGFPAGWKGKGDGSLFPCPRDTMGIEFVSPVLRDIDGLTQIATVCDQLNSWETKVNEKTGFHVHVGFPWIGRAAVKILGHLVHLVAHHEKSVYASTGTRRREMGSFCKSLHAGQHRSMAFGARDVGTMHIPPDRYYSLNLSNLISNRHQTVEFRAFAGTTNKKKMIAHVRMCLAFVHRAWTMAERDVPRAAFTPRLRAPVPDITAGRFAIEHFFTAMGWKRGQADAWLRYGGLVAPNMPIEESCEILGAMAEKYDTGHRPGRGRIEASVCPLENIICEPSSIFHAQVGPERRIHRISPVSAANDVMAGLPSLVEE